ncbi:ABC transporter substrate-binding protein [Phytohabitans rumicis]|uniref:ABC transporter substrate-binding protein n=1 Tax=Phytohabitans rumicis TaxID=1076125 RepID=A0A6V8LLU1_9ACTN|nr:ABC transporter substrate-binding protein [Phytohabitans rumicis]GFJ95589.1 ABC transporter substrate-binding protein [Phytohabitans rumicis]
MHRYRGIRRGGAGPSAIRGRRLAPAALLVTIALATAACGGGSEPKSDTLDQLVIVSSDDPATFAADSGGYSGKTQTSVVINTQATLVRNPYIKDATTGVLKQDWSAFEGVLATSWDVGENGLTYTFHLREGVKSQAGNPFTADDVIWSFERHYSADTSSTQFVFAPYVSGLDAWKKIDEHTVSLTLQHAGDGITVLSLLSNLDAQIFDSTFLKTKATPDDPFAVTWSKTEGGWGYGAYKMVSYTPGESVVLEANPNYPLGEPEIKKLTFKVVPEAGTRAAAIQAGDADVALDLLPSQIADLTGGSVQTYKQPTNQHIKMPLITTKAPFDNIAVRQAFAYAIPYDQIIENVYLGQAARMSSVLRPDSPNYVGTGLETIPYDPAKAKSILAEAGVQTPVAVELTVNSGIPDAVDTAIQIQSSAEEAGFNVKIREIAPPEFSAGRNSGKFQAFLDRDSAFVMTPAYQLRLWTDKGSPFNLAQWESKDFYAAMATALAVPTRSVRRACRSGTPSSRCGARRRRLSSSPTSSRRMLCAMGSRASRPEVTWASTTGT